ncbi:MAG: hypothetical protein WCF67_08940 [Chitinophagaceae bacterium]
MNYLRQHSLLSAILINLVLFGCVLLFGFPVFNSGDDAYLLYLLGGGFGQAPTELLHYHYGMHPYVGLLIKNAFVYFPGFNWYSFFLYALHFIACSAMLAASIRKHQLTSGIGYYLLFFIIEVFFLLQPSFTNTALVTAIAGCLLLYAGLTDETKPRQLILWGCVLLIGAALLRLHMLAPPLLLSAPFLIASLTKKKIRPLLLFASVTSVIILLLVFLQQQYYTQRIPGWQQEESYRQAIIDHYNKPKKKINDIPAAFRTQAHFLERGVLWDTAFLSQQQVAATTRAMQIKTAASQDDFRARLFWLMMESRMGILLIIMMILWRSASLIKREKYAMLGSALIFIALCTVLILFRKLPGYIVTGGMLQLLAFLSLSGRKPQQYAAPIPWVLTGASAILLIWGVIRLNKLNQHNKQQYEFWQCAYAQVASHTNKLLIVADDKFPVDYFYVWHVPKRYPLPNLLTKDHFLNNTYSPAYRKYGITSPIQSSNVLFTGMLGTPDMEYLESASGKHLNLLPMKDSDCVQLWELR